MNGFLKKTFLKCTVLTLLLITLLAGCSSTTSNDSVVASSTVQETTAVMNSKDNTNQSSTVQYNSTVKSSTTTDLSSGDSTNQTSESIIYLNAQYSFTFRLPESWKGYKIISGKWEGLIMEPQGEKVSVTGPMISIRHPLWTDKEPRQDIPIMVFTLEQWDSLQHDKFHIGAAPVNPSELGRNSQYVFALPARYNFAFPTGYEEVQDIINSKPLKPVSK